MKVGYTIKHIGTGLFISVLNLKTSNKIILTYYTEDSWILNNESCKIGIWKPKTIKQ